jgi:hypothetical protein
MDIGPISAIRPVAMIKPSTAAPDLTRVFEVEYLGQSGDDEYTPTNRNEARRPEDEEDEATAASAQAVVQPDRYPSPKVSFFA